MSEFDDPGSRVEAEVQNLLGAENELDPPGSNIEEMLTNLLNGDAVELKGDSRIEKLVKRIADEGGGGDISVRSFTATENGTYTAPSGTAYSPVTVDVEPDLTTKSITANGTYQAASDNVDGYSAVTVDVEPDLIAKSITENGTYAASGDNVDGYSAVTVDVEANVGTKSITQNGTYTAASEQLDGYSEVTVNVSGGGGQEVPEKDVNFIDYDGTVLYSYTAQEALALTALPANPSHEGLTAQGWNYTLAEVKTEVNSVGGATVGQMYVTDDGKTRIYCTFGDGRQVPSITLGINGTVVIDWGDGTAQSTMTGSNVNVAVSESHTYAKGGDYTISLAVNGTARIFGDSSAWLIRAIYDGTRYPGNSAYQAAVNKIEIGTGIIISTYAFTGLKNLKSVTFPSTVTVERSYYMFSECYTLPAIVFSTAFNKLESSACSTDYALENISIPINITNIDSSLCRNANVLRRFYIPNGIPKIPTEMLYNCKYLTKITVPASVVTINSKAFYACTGVAEYHFKAATPPTITSDAFTNISADCKIYVPAASLSTYQSATNWSAYASQMIGE